MLAGAGTYGECERGKETPFLHHFDIKCIISPRQARDKLRESTQKKTVFPSGFVLTPTATSDVFEAVSSEARARKVKVVAVAVPDDTAAAGATMEAGSAASGAGVGSAGSAGVGSAGTAASDAVASAGGTAAGAGGTASNAAVAVGAPPEEGAAANHTVVLGPSRTCDASIISALFSPSGHRPQYGGESGPMHCAARMCPAETLSMAALGRCDKCEGVWTEPVFCLSFFVLLSIIYIYLFLIYSLPRQAWDKRKESSTHSKSALAFFLALTQGRTRCCTSRTLRFCRCGNVSFLRRCLLKHRIFPETGSGQT